MTTYRKILRTPEEILAARIDALEKQVKALQTNKVATVPIYDSTFPSESVYGQVALNSDDNTLNVYGIDDAWHSGSGGLTEIDSLDGTISVSNPTGPIVDLSVNFPASDISHDYEIIKQTGTTGTACANDTATLLDWTKDATASTATLLDLTTPTVPKIIASGVYAFSMWVWDQNGVPSAAAPSFYPVRVEAYYSPAGTPVKLMRAQGATYKYGSPAFVYGYATQVCITRYMAANTTLGIYVLHEAGASVNFNVQGTVAYIGA